MKTIQLTQKQTDDYIDALMEASDDNLCMFWQERDGIKFFNDETPDDENCVVFLKFNKK